MRLFTGIDLPDHAREKLERLLSQLRPTAHLKWSPVYNLHITLKFIGEWPESKLEHLDEALHSLPKCSEQTIEVRGLGWFPNLHRPRVFWVGVHGAGLAKLAQDTETALEPLGIKKDERAFTAHLTLARIKEPTPLQALRDTVAKMEPAEFGSFRAPAFHLYRSQPGAAGSIYTKLSDYPFETA